MQTYKPQVKDISLFKEIASNIINPLEILREGISNSHDADAKSISIIVYRDKIGKFIIEIQDDGNGMSINDLHRFFNLGDSDKEKRGIGEKGLGTKIYFKSDKIILTTQTKEGEAYRVTMDKPWEYLSNNILPEYIIEEVNVQNGNCGTTIYIEGYKMDNPEKYFNFDMIQDYILWFTAAGSFKTYFANCMELHKYIHNMQVAPRVFIEDRMQGIKEEIAGMHQFHPPQEKPKEDAYEVVYKRSVNYCRHFGPYHRATNINGEYVSFQIYGTVSGVNCRRRIAKLKQGETLKCRFGVYVAKDFIPFAKKNNLLPDPVHQHYHLLINSQCFELTADRNSISNQEDPKVKWVFEEARKIISEDIIPLAEEGYFNLRRNEEVEHIIREKRRKVYERLESFDKVDNLNIDDLSITKLPDNESQVVILFAMLIMNSRGKELLKYIDKIGHYSQQSTTDMICIDKNGDKVLVEVEYKLSSLFKHDHPYNTFDYVVCWKVDLDVNDRRNLFNEDSVNLVCEGGEWMIKYGTQKAIPVIELRSIIHQLQESYINYA